MSEFNEQKKSCRCKHAGLVLATLLGSFLAFYVVSDITFKHMLSSEYKMHQLMKEADKDILPTIISSQKIFDTIHLIRGEDEYKLVINLTPFNNNEDNIRLDIKENLVTISGIGERIKGAQENILEFSQTFELPEKIDISKVTKTKKNNKFVITLPEVDE